MREVIQMNEQHDVDENNAPDITEENQEGQEEVEQGPNWESELDSYPLREAGEDPRWALRTVWIWTGFAIASIIFILTLLVLGAIYD